MMSREDMPGGLLDTIVGFVFGAGGATVLNWLLRRRETSADIAVKQQQVIESLWNRIDELQNRVNELEQEISRLQNEVLRLRRLLHAYERRFGRAFVIAQDGSIMERSDRGGSDE